MSIQSFRIRSPLLIAAFVFARLVLPTGLRAADEPKPEAEPQSAPQVEPQAEPVDYDVIPFSEKLAFALGDTPQDKKQRNDLDVKKEAILRGSESFEAQATKDFLQNYYSRYYFPLLTYPKNIGDWPKTRVNLTRTLAATNLQTPPLLQVHDFLVEVVYQSMLPLIRGNYHPAVRCNAMLLLGSLNSQDPLFVGDAKRPPVPLIKSLGVMLSELGNPQQIDGVRAAALVGILRHVEIDRQLADGERRLAEGNRDAAIADAMLKLVNEKQAPEGRTQAGHDWMRRRAIEILGYLGSPGQNNSVVAGLDGLLTDNKAPVSLRCAAAEAMGRLRLPANAGIKISDAAKKLATVAVFACQKEIQRVEDQETREAKDKLQAIGGAGYGMGGGYMDASGYGGSMGGMPSMMPEMGGMPYGMPGGSSGGMMPGYGMPEYGMPGAAPAAKFNPLGYRILLTRRRIAHEMLLVKRGLLGPDATLKTSPAAAAAAAAAAKTTPTAAPPTPKAGLSALVKAGADQTAVDDALNGIDSIIKVVEQSTFNEMKALVEELRGKVRQMEDKCGIVVELEEEPVPGAALDNPLANPLDMPAGVPGLEIPSVPAEPPAAAPAGKVPAGQPAAAAPEAAPPAVPAPVVPAPAGGPEPAAGEAPPAAPVPPTPAPGGPAPPAGPPPAAAPAAGNAPKA